MDILDDLKKVTIPKEIFRAYDIRGIVDVSLTPSIMYIIGRALAFTVLEAGEKKLLVARDGRLSGPSLLSAFKKGALSTGIDIVDIGEVPTPLLYFATHYYNIPSGAVLTGSHNPSNYNGVKMMVGGEALYGEGIQALYQRILRIKTSESFVDCFGNSDNPNIGKETHGTILPSYLQAVLKDIRLKKPLKIVVDCGNGVAGNTAPKLYQELGCEVIPLFCEVDGRFPNHHPDPSKPENLTDLIAAVAEHKADLGLAFDGDGDRLGVVDNTGKMIWSDRLLILFAESILIHHPNAAILFDVKCSRHVEREIHKAKGKPLMWKTGHSFMKAKMKETGALLAGEMSGHLFFKDRWFGFDDALYAGARLLEMVAMSNVDVATLCQKVPESVTTPELSIEVQEDEKSKIVETMIQQALFEDAKINTIDGLRVDFLDGFGLIRPSNTGPNLVLRFEGDTPSALKRIQGQFQLLLSSAAPELMIPR